jgi:hypothetical protein
VDSAFAADQECVMLAEGLFSWLTSWNDGVLKMAILIGGIAIVLSVWAIASAWKSIRCSEHQTRLTALMLERGMKPDEIERLLRAGPILAMAIAENKSADLADNDPEVRIVNALAGQSYEGDDVEKVLSAARESGPIDEPTVGIVKAMAESWADADDIAKVLRNRRPRGAGSPSPVPATA